MTESTKTEAAHPAPKTTSPSSPVWRLLRRGVLTLLAFCVLCWGLLWGVLPGQLQKAAASWAQQHGRKLQLDNIEINPFTLRLSIGRIALDEGNGAPLLHADSFVVNAEAWALLLGRWQLSELTFNKPQLYIERDNSGVWNWARFIADINRDKSPSPAKQDDSLPKLLLEHIALNNGQLYLRDRIAGDTNLHALPLALKLQQISTLPQPGGYTLATVLEDGARLDWRGSLRLQPLQSSGVLKVSGFTPASIWGYIRPQFNVAPPQGKLSLTLPYQFDLAGKAVQLSSHGFAANLDGLALAAPGSNSPFKLGKLAISAGEFDLARQHLTLGNVLLADAELATVLDQQGHADWLAALPATPNPAPVAATKKSSNTPGWTVSLPAIQLQNWQLRAEHRGFVTPLDASLKLDTLHAAAQLDAKGGLSVKQATLSLSTLAAASAGKPPFATLASATLAASELDLAKRELRPGDISLGGLQLAVSRSRDGKLDIAELLRQHPAHKAAAVATSGKAPDSAPDKAAWHIRYPALTLTQSRLNWRDATTTQPVLLALSDIDAKLDGDAEQGFALALSAAVGQGKLQASATLAANLGAIKGTFKADRLPLKEVAPYALDKTILRFGGGELSADLGFGLNGARWQADGRAAISKLALYEPGQREMLLGWQQLQISGIKAQPDKVSLGDVRLVAPQLRLILDEKRVPNFAHLLKPDAASSSVAASQKTASKDSGSKPPPGSNSGKAMLVDVRAIRVRDARMDFADLGMNPSFATRIHSLSGTVLGLSTAKGRRGTVTLDGRVDQFGDVRIRGALSPLAITDDLDMALNFRNIALGSLNPYSMTFAGWKITDGRLSTELRYLLQKRQLKGENRMVIDHIQLGDEVANYEGTRLPLRLAVALLEDSDGRIDLSLPVAGSLDAPEFSYGQLVWQAFKNILVKIATAPFRALFGGEGFDSIYTDAGDARIPPPEREKLQKLAELLVKRPKLNLAIGGGFDVAQDSRELARYRVDGDILKRAAYKLQPDEPLPLPDMVDPAIRKAVGDSYALQFGRFAWLKRVASEADTPARAQAMRSELLAAQKIDDAALKALAKARGDAARQLLLATKPELATRITLLDADKVKADKDGVPLLLKLH